MAKFTVSDFRAVDKKVREGDSERRAAMGNESLRTAWRKWVKLGRPDQWPISNGMRLSCNELSQESAIVVSLDDLDSKLLLSCWQNCARNSAWAKLTLEVLKILHTKYQDKASAENNVQLYLDGMRDLLEGRKDESEKGTAKN